MTSKTTPSSQSEPTAKNRLTPIKETMQTIRGYPSSLVIYKTAASRFYWVRCYFNGKYKVKTTKSETVKSAKEFAAQFYKDTLLSSVTTKTSDRNKQFAVVTASDINAAFGSAKPAKAKTKTAKTPKAGKKTGKVAPKYRNPANHAETWTGRGVSPKWVAELKASGTLESALIAHDAPVAHVEAPAAHVEAPAAH